MQCQSDPPLRLRCVRVTSGSFHHLFLSDCKRSPTQSIHGLGSGTDGIWQGNQEQGCPGYEACTHSCRLIRLIPKPHTASFPRPHPVHGKYLQSPEHTVTGALHTQNTNYLVGMAQLCRFVWAEACTCICTYTAVACGKVGIGTNAHAWLGKGLCMHMHMHFGCLRNDLSGCAGLSR